jgi:hypothetical protein
LCSDFLTGNAWASQESRRLIIAAVAGALVLPLLALGFVQVRRHAAGRLVSATLLLGLVGMAVASAAVAVIAHRANARLYQPRNMLVLLYPYGIVLLAGCLALPRPVLSRAAVGAILGLTLASTLAVLTVGHDQPTVMSPNPDWRRVAALLQRDAADWGDRPPVVWSRSPVFPLTYYAPRAEVQSTWGGELNVGQLVGAVSAGRRVYVIDDRRWWPLGEAERAALNQRASAALRFSVGQVDVYRLDPVGP